MTRLSCILLALALLVPSTLDAQQPQPADTLGAVPNPSMIDLMVGAGKLVQKTVDHFNRYDTAYIEPDHYDWTLMFQNSNFMQYISISGKPAGGDDYQTLGFAPKPAFKVGPYIGWRWLFVGYGIDVSRPSKAGKSTEFDFGVYTNKIGGDIVYVRNKGGYSLRHTSGFDNLHSHTLRGKTFAGLDMGTLSLNAYYVFNHRHYSNPAAYNQSTRQKRSAGSFILGLRYDRQRIGFDYMQLPRRVLYADDGTPQLSDELKFRRLQYQDYCVSVGYAYNWVLARHWTLGLSGTPAVGYRKEKGETKEKTFDTTIASVMHYMAFDFIGRAGLVWNTGKHFAGARFVTHLYGYRSHHLYIANSVNYFNLYAGFYFGRRH